MASPDNRSELPLWLDAPSTLFELGDSLRKHGIITDYTYDAENVYEWIECSLPNTATLNLSRSHGELSDEPPGQLSGCLLSDTAPDDTALKDIAKALHQALAIPVHIGTTVQTGPDTFTYDCHETFGEI